MDNFFYPLFCHGHCRKSALPAPGYLPGGSEIAPDLSAIPAEYQDLREVLSKETKEMETYIEDSVATGFIRPSASTAGIGYLFVEKRTKPCTCASTTGASTTSR
jgi:hypothetical protein